MTSTFEELIAQYADRIGNALGIQVTDDDRTREGFPQLLTTCAGRVGDHTRGCLTEAASDLDIINGLGDDSDKARTILDQVNLALYDATRDIELSC